MSNQEHAGPLISIALCTYNGAAHLREQMDSLLAQTGVRFEIVALDDSSSDESVAILEDYAAPDARVRVARNARNLGHLRSFEACMAMCQGDFIAPSDQDDIWLPEKLKSLLDVIGHADVAYCDSAYMDGEGVPTGRHVSNDFAMFEGNDPMPLLFQNTISGHAMLIRRDLIEVAGPAPDGLFHDWWLGLCAAGRNGVVYLDKALVRFRRHAQASTAIGTEKAKIKTPSSNRIWIEERIKLARQFAALNLRGAAFAKHFASAMEETEAGRLAPVARVIWQFREHLPPARKPGWLKAIKLLSRVRRKASRAKNEPAPA